MTNAVTTELSCTSCGMAPLLPDEEASRLCDECSAYRVVHGVLPDRTWVQERLRRANGSISRASSPAAVVNVEESTRPSSARMAWIRVRATSPRPVSVDVARDLLLEIDYLSSASRAAVEVGEVVEIREWVARQEQLLPHLRTGLGHDAVSRLLAHLDAGRGATDEMVKALADCVTKATEYGQQDGGFVRAYILPTGPIHRAIALLDTHGVTVRSGFDGRQPLTPEQQQAVDDYTREMTETVIPEIVRVIEQRAVQANVIRHHPTDPARVRP